MKKEEEGPEFKPEPPSDTVLVTIIGDIQQFQGGAPHLHMIV